MMYRKIKEIVFCFENLEQFAVPASEVEVLSFRGIHTNIRMQDGHYSEHECCGEAFVVLKEGANKAVSSFDLYSRECCSDMISLFERLLFWDDCVGIDIVYEPEKEHAVPERREIYIPWEDDGTNEHKSKLQKAFWQEDPELHWENCLCVHFGEKWDTFPNPEANVLPDIEEEENNRE